jgi:histidine triad (HIT) family protein
MSEPDFDNMTPEQVAEYQKQNCVFCKIIAGDIPARKIYEDDKVLCIMDIYPACKGHLLMMPKEHYPFLPVIPPELSMHMFRISKDVSKSAKSAIITDKATIFIANGGIAGQQSPHFLFHIIPRENNDGLENFHVPAKELDAALGETEKIAPMLRQRLSAILQGVHGVPQQGGRQLPPQQAQKAQQAQAQPQSSQRESAPGVKTQAQPQSPEQKQGLAELILDNPEVKDMIINNPAAFKSELENNPDLKKVFEGVDIEKLALALKTMKPGE